MTQGKDSQPETRRATAGSSPGQSSSSESDTNLLNDSDAALMQSIFGDQEVIISHGGSSQYVGGGISACGLAAMNCVRIIFEKATSGLVGEALLQDLTTKQTAEDVISICTHWTGSSHLEVEDILKSPYFETTLQSTRTYFSHPTTSKFRNLIRQMQATRSPTGVVAAVVTRPPEIIAVIKVSSTFGDAFVIFDSHPRPAYPAGAAFVFNSSLDAIARRLADLMAVDGQILADHDLQWQTQLLDQFSGLILVPRDGQSSPSQADLFNWSLAMLSAKADAADAKQALSNMAEDKESLAARNARLAAELAAARAELEELRSRRESWFPAWGLASSGKKKVLDGTFPRDGSQFPVRESNYAAPRNGWVEPGQGFSPVAATQTWYRPAATQNPEAGPSTRSSTNRAVPGSGSSTDRTRPQGKQSDRSPSKKQVRSETQRSNSKHRADSSSQKSKSSPTGAQQGSDRPSAPTDFSQDDHELAAKLQQEMQTSIGDSLFAARLQRELEIEDRELAAQQARLLANIQRSFRCGICLDEHPEEDIARMPACEHPLCRDCARQWILSRVHEHRYPILCPICVAQRDEKETEPGIMTDEMVQQIGIPEEIYKTFVEMQLASFSIMLHCRGCRQTAFVDREEVQASKILTCPLQGCTYQWCKSCEQAIEPTGGAKHSCDGSSELEHLMKQQGWKHCPGCRTPIQKESGCNHMTCSSPGCNTHFCYRCGELIITSAIPREVSDAITRHYSRCNLFEYQN